MFVLRQAQHEREINDSLKFIPFALSLSKGERRRTEESVLFLPPVQAGARPKQPHHPRQGDKKAVEHDVKRVEDY
jgi:hypothetical protein